MRELNAHLFQLYVAVDLAENVYVVTSFGSSYTRTLRKITRDGTITTVAVAADFFGPLAVDVTGNLYLYAGSSIHKIAPDGTMTTAVSLPIDATGARSDVGDLDVDYEGNFYLSDGGNSRLLKITPDGFVTTIAETGARPYGIATNYVGDVYFTDNLTEGRVARVSWVSRIKRLSSDGIVTTVAGAVGYGFSGDDGPATLAEMSYAIGVGLDARGNVYIADENNRRIRMVGTDGVMRSIAGNGTMGFSGDGGPALEAMLGSGSGALAVHPSGTIYYADWTNNRIRKISCSYSCARSSGSSPSRRPSQKELLQMVPVDKLKPTPDPRKFERR